MLAGFPGIDPYLEAAGIWGDFHLSLIAVLREELNARLPKGLVARADLSVWFENDPHSSSPRRKEPDVYVTGKPANGGVATAAPMMASTATVVTLPQLRPHQRRYLKIVDTREREIVTAIEILSPSNKTKGLDRQRYLAKRRDYLGSGVNFVELDLLRQGKRMPMGKPNLPLSDFFVFVSKAADHPLARVWRISIRDLLPEIPIPLTAETPDVLLPLASSVARVYAHGRYEADLDYERALMPPLAEPDAAWASQLIADYFKKQQEPPQGVSS